MKFNLFVVSVLSVGYFLAMGGCQAQEPATEPEFTQAEQNTTVSINVMGETTVSEDGGDAVGEGGEL